MEDFLNYDDDDLDLIGEGAIFESVREDEKLIEKTIKGLNKEQTKMVYGVLEYIHENKGNKNYYLVQGSGGTGKSFAIGKVLKLISGYSIVAAAPSHFAKNILKNFLDSFHIKVYTVAALLGKKLTFNDKGELILVDNKSKLKPPITYADIVIIDEISMIDDATTKELLDRCNYKKLLILGDYCQLPPVGQHTDNLFFDNISIELIHPMRFSGHIYNLANAVREQINKSRQGLFANINIITLFSKRISKINEEGSGYIFLNSFNPFINAAIKRFKENKDINYVRILAYRNKTIHTLNRIVRKSLYGEHANQFEKGELVINEGGYKQDITNGEFLVVSKINKITGPYQIPCVRLSFKDSQIQVPVVADEGKKEYDDYLHKLKLAAYRDSRKWEEYYSFLEKFAYFKYSYAVSVHKAQGSTVRNTFILEDDILTIKPISIKEKLQSLYVAITRTSFRLFIYNKNLKVDNSKLNVEHLKKR